MSAEKKLKKKIAIQNTTKKRGYVIAVQGILHIMGGNKMYILSWGGGVNSTAILAMMKLGMLPELTPENTHIVFADTGAEMPYTYEHATRCAEIMKKYKWVCLRPYDERWKKFYSPRCKDKTLTQFCLEHKWIPSRMNRWCTKEYKIIPITNYRKSFGETTVILGIAKEEIHRAKEMGNPFVKYPLIEQGLDRENCIELIKKADFPIARKSGCFYCPFQRKASWLQLYAEYKDLFLEAVELEKNAHLKWSDKFSLTALPLEQQIQKWLKKEKAKCDQRLCEL